MRLMVLGIDGLSWRTVAPWLADGSLPHLASLMARGTHGVLASTTPPLTPPAWFSSLTGVNPGRQNVFGFFRPPRERYAKVPISFADLSAPAVWDWLGAAGKRSLILYLPLTYPPRAIAGAMVSGFMTPDGARDYAQPPEVREEIEGAVPGFRLNVDHAAIRLGRMEEFYQDAREVLEFQVRAALHLLGSRPWDLFFIHLHDIDSVTHQFWKHHDPAHPAHRPGNPHRDKLREYHREVDAAVGRLTAAAGEETGVLLYSDHGFMPATRAFNPNRWLAERGHLSLRGRHRLGLKSLLSRAGLGRERLAALAGRLGLRPLLRRLPAGVKAAVPRTRFSFDAVAPHVDWPATRAFFLAASEGSIYLNIRGREPQGSLPPDRADALLREIRDGLLEARDPATGARVLAAAHLGREVFWGPHAAAGPDLVLIPADGWFFTENPFAPLVTPQGTGDHELSATHHPEGVYLAAGGPFAPRGRGRDLAIADVAPTLLRALDAPIPEGLDGTPAEDLLDDGFLFAHPRRTAPPLTPPGSAPTGDLPPGERQAIIRNLESLGYF